MPRYVPVVKAVLAVEEAVEHGTFVFEQRALETVGPEAASAIVGAIVLAGNVQ